MKLTVVFLAIILLTADFTVKAEEQFQFVAEVGRLMDIIIHSLYTQKQIFLRQLISNASDALDKIRFLAISSPDILGEETELEIKIQLNQDENYLEIIDNGIGMTKNDLVNNLGIVAKSGTTSFLDALERKDINLIGQFGVGFYSSFLVASKVEVISKHNDDVQHKWTSSASNTFTVEENSEIELKRGTMVRLHLKEDAREFNNPEELEKLVKKYSSFISYPIYLEKKVTSSEKIEKTEEELEKEKEEMMEKYKEEGKEIDEEEIENSIERMVQKTTQSYKFQRVNEEEPLWVREKDELKKTEYEEFFKTVFRDTNPPISWNHFKAEGDVHFTSILFIPERSSFDQYDKFYEKKAEVKLYVRRVLINEEFDDLLPKYLNFIKGVVDSDELPLNVNRETLQQKKTFAIIKKQLEKKAINMLVDFNPGPEDEDEELFSEDSDEENYEKEGFASKREKKIDTFNKFWKNYQKNIKLGMIEDYKNRAKLAELTRWYTTNNVSELTSLDDYISRMKEGQQLIYFIGGEDRNTLQHSPLIERLVSEGYEVILGDDPLDERVFFDFNKYKDYNTKNVAKIDFVEPYKKDEQRKEVKALKKQFTPLIDYAKKELSEHIRDVKVSLRLLDNPVVVVADMNGETPNSERLQEAAALGGRDRYRKQKRILQINPQHPTIQQLNKIVEDEPDEQSSQLIQNLYYAGLIHSGFLVKDPEFFSKSVFSLINTAFEVKNEVEEIVVTEEDIESMEPAPEEKEVQEEPVVDDMIDLDVGTVTGEVEANEEPEQNMDL